MKDQTQQNTVNIAILQTQYSSIESTLLEVKSNQKEHEARDVQRHEDVLNGLKEQHEDNDEIKQMISDIKKAQAIEKMKLSVIVGGVILVAKELVIFLVHKII